MRLRGSVVSFTFVSSCTKLTRAPCGDPPGVEVHLSCTGGRCQEDQREFARCRSDRCPLRWRHWWVVNLDVLNLESVGEAFRHIIAVFSANHGLVVPAERMNPTGWTKPPRGRKLEGRGARPFGRKTHEQTIIGTRHVSPPPQSRRNREPRRKQSLNIHGSVV